MLRPPFRPQTPKVPPWDVHPASSWRGLAFQRHFHNGINESRQKRRDLTPRAELKQSHAMSTDCLPRYITWPVTHYRAIPFDILRTDNPDTSCKPSGDTSCPRGSSPQQPFATLLGPTDVAKRAEVAESRDF